MGSRDRKGCEPRPARAIRNPAIALGLRDQEYEHLSRSVERDRSRILRVKQKALGVFTVEIFTSRFVFRTPGKKVEVLLLLNQAQRVKQRLQ